MTLSPLRLLLSRRLLCWCSGSPPGALSAEKTRRNCLLASRLFSSSRDEGLVSSGAEEEMKILNHLTDKNIKKSPKQSGEEPRASSSFSSKSSSLSSRMNINTPIASPGSTRLLPMRDVDGAYRELKYLDTCPPLGRASFPLEGGKGASPSPVEEAGDGAERVSNCEEHNDRVLVILCGTAQSIPTWSLHTRQWAKTRRVLIPELRSQGRTTSLLTEHCTLIQHVQDLKQFLEHSQLQLGKDQTVDLVGFSLGGRIGLSFAEAYPGRVRSVSVTGVPHQRPYLGQLILRSWMNGLQADDIEGTAMSFFENGLTPKFMKRNERSIRRMMDDVIAANDSKRLVQLLGKALESGALGMGVTPNDPDPDQAVSIMRGRLKLHCRAQVIASEEDRLAGSNSERRLAEVIQEHHAIPGYKCRFDKILNCGHLAPFERPGEWRNLVLDFIDGAD